MKDTINLLPKKGLKEPKEKARVTRRFVLGSFISLLLFLAWLIPFVILLRLNQEHNATIAKITQKEEGLKGLSGEESAYRNVFNKAKGAQVIFQKNQALLRHLTDIKTITQPVLIKSITLDTDSVKLTIATSDTASMLTYLNTLEDEGSKQKIFKSLTISSIAVSKTSGYEVKIEGTL